MAKNFTKTLQGKQIDMEELALRNENTRAVGNMNVNAKGEADNENNTVATKTHKPGKGERRRHENRVQDAPVMNSKRAAKELARQYIEREMDVIPGLDSITEVQAEPVVEEVKPVAPAPKPKPVVAQPAPVKKPTPAPEPAPVVMQEQPKEEVSDEVLQKVISKSTGGLAGAIAKAKEVKQEPLKTPREEARSGDGVKRI